MRLLFQEYTGEERDHGVPDLESIPVKLVRNLCMFSHPEYYLNIGFTQWGIFSLFSCCTALDSSLWNKNAHKNK